MFDYVLHVYVYVYVQLYYEYGPPHMAVQKQDDQHEHTYSSYVRIRDVALKTCQRRWMIGRSGERGSGISVLAARHDHDDTTIALSILVKLSPSFLSIRLVSIQVVHPYSSMDTTTAWKKLRFILSDSSDSYMTDNLSIAVRACAGRVLMSFSVDEMLLLK